MSPPTDEPLAGLRFSLAGPGRVGRSLAGWLVGAGARCLAVAGRDTARAREAAAGLGAAALGIGDLASAGQALLLVTVSDPALEPVAEALAGRPQAAVALHAAGALDASVLAPLRRAGCAIGTFHPLLAFPAELPPDAAQGAVFAVEGDPPAVALARRLAAGLGGRPVDVPAEARLLYHFAASLAAGGVLTLCAMAEEIAAAQGLAPEVGRGYLRLASGALGAALAEGTAAAALTGPVARGESELVSSQLDRLAAERPDLARLAARLALETLHQLARQGRCGPRQEALRAALERRLGVDPPRNAVLS